MSQWREGTERFYNDAKSFVSDLSRSPSVASDISRSRSASRDFQQAVKGKIGGFGNGFSKANSGGLIG